MIPFKPVIEHEHDGAFLTQHPREIIKNGEIAQIPWITGITSSEGVLRTAAIISDIRLMDELDERFDKLIPMSLMYEKTSTNPEFVTKALKEFYFNNGSVAASPRERLIDVSIISVVFRSMLLNRVSDSCIQMAGSWLQLMKR